MKGFPIGAEGGHGSGYPLVAPGIATTNQPIYRASTSINTVDAMHGYSRVNYPAKIRTIVHLTTAKPSGRSSTFLYKRPERNEVSIRVAAEFSVVNRHLRVMVSDARSGVTGGYGVVDRSIYCRVDTTWYKSRFSWANHEPKTTSREDRQWLGELLPWLDRVKCHIPLHHYIS